MKRFSMSVATLLILFLSNLSAQPSDCELIWSDEFNYTGLPDSTLWGYDVGKHGWGNDELEFYTYKRPENARVENGKLTIETIKEDYQGMRFTSARLVSLPKNDLLYGRIEIRAKLPAGRGSWPAGWMLSRDWAYGAWPESGEIDLIEHVGFDMDVNHVSVHSLAYYWKKGTQKTALYKVDKIDSTFNTYAIEWRPNRIDAFVGDSLYFSCYNEQNGWQTWPFDKPFYLILNTAVGGSWGGERGVDENVWPQKFEIDYVRVYKYKAPQDNIAPSAPTKIKHVAADNRITLLWEPAYDKYSVKEYKIISNNKLVGTSKIHSFEVINLVPTKKYDFQIIAVDYSGNESEPLVGSFETLTKLVNIVPGKIEAENYTVQKDMITESVTDSLDGFDLCFMEPGEWVEYTINANKSGEYTINYRAATERKETAIELYNAENKLLCSTPIANTKSWQAWKDYSSTKFILKNGIQKIKLKVVNDRMSLNWFEIKEAK
jgi:beta-glucanase (GH16 family)